MYKFVIFDLQSPTRRLSRTNMSNISSVVQKLSCHEHINFLLVLKTFHNCVGFIKRKNIINRIREFMLTKISQKMAFFTGLYENKVAMDFSQIGRNSRFSGSTHTLGKLHMCLLYFAKGEVSIKVSLATFRLIIAPIFTFLCIFFENWRFFNSIAPWGVKG